MARTSISGLFKKGLVAKAVLVLTVVAAVALWPSHALPDHRASVHSDGRSRLHSPEVATKSREKATSTSRQAEPDCATADIKVSQHLAGLAAANSYLVFVLTNSGASACALSGVPSLVVDNSAGAQVYVPSQQASGYVPSSTVVLSANGGEASFWVDFTGCHDATAASTAAPDDGFLAIAVNGLPSAATTPWPTQPECSGQQLTISAVAEGNAVAIPGLTPVSEGSPAGSGPPPSKGAPVGSSGDGGTP